MSYYFSKTLHCGFDEAVHRTAEGLKKAGFGIITEIDVKETLKKKLGADFRNYRILGARNPRMAHEALDMEDKIGTMLPCNIIVQDVGGDETEVAAIDPVKSMAAVSNPSLKLLAGRVGDMLKSVIETL